MSNYDYRDRPAYREVEPDPKHCQNPHILKWWRSEHDQIIKEQILANQWIWYWTITTKIVEHTSSHVIEAWKKSDPLCQQYAWYNTLMRFSESRAKRLGLTKLIRQPEWKTCLLCGEVFVENSLPVPLVERLGIDHLDFCAPCLRDTVLPNKGDPSASREKIINYLQGLSSVLGCVPTQGFGENKDDLLGLSSEERLDVLRMLQQKPTVSRVKEAFGSWLNALIKAEILEDGTRMTRRGIQSIAKDGHVCLSLGERTIDDFLCSRGVMHEKEPRYPEGNYRADFKIGRFFVEYFGMAGNPDYDAKSKEKIRICKKYGFPLIPIYPKDLVTQQRLEKKLAPLLTVKQG